MVRRNLVGLVLVLLLAACGEAETTARAEAAIGAFHLMLAEEDHDGIWRGADPEFRRGTSREAWARFVRIHKRLGAPRGFEIENWATGERSGGPDRLAVTTRTRFEHGRAREAFTFAETPDGLALLRYDILDPEVGGDGG